MSPNRKYEFVLQEETITVLGKQQTTTVRRPFDEASKKPESQIYTEDGEPLVFVFPRQAINHSRTKPVAIEKGASTKSGGNVPERKAHKLAKYALCVDDRIAIPSGDDCLIAKIEREKKLGNIKADLVVTDYQGRQLIIEFFMTNMKEGKSAIKYTETCREECIQGIEIDISFIQEDQLDKDEKEAIKQIRQELRKRKTKTRIIFEDGQEDNLPNKWTDKPNHYLSFTKQEQKWRKEVYELERRIERNKESTRIFKTRNGQCIRTAEDCQKIQREILSIERRIGRKEKAIESNKKGIQSNNANIEYWKKAINRIENQIRDTEPDPF